MGLRYRPARGPGRRYRRPAVLLRPRQPSRPVLSMRRSRSLPARMRARWTNSSEPRSTSFAPASPSPPIVAARHRPCCSRRPSDWSGSTAAAREIYLDALTAALFAGRLGAAGDARQVATAACAAPPPAPPPRAADLLLDGLALLISEGRGRNAGPTQDATFIPQRRDQNRGRAALAVARRSGSGIHLGLRRLGFAHPAADPSCPRGRRPRAPPPRAQYPGGGPHLRGRAGGGRVAGRGGGRPRRGDRWSHRPPVRGPRAGRLSRPRG